MKPIVTWTLQQRKVSVIWWSLAIFLLIFINMIFYPSFKDQAAELQKSFSNLPEATLQFIGGSADFFTPVGFLNSQIYFLMLPLLLGVLSIGLGSSLLGREEQDKTIEVLLSKPIARDKLLSAKALTGVIILGLVSLVGLMVVLTTSKMVDLEISSGTIIVASVACFLVTLSFGAVAFVLAATGKARSASIGVATFVGLGGYIISSLAGTVDWLKTPAKLFPFHYYETESILRGSTNWWHLALLGLVSVTLFWLALIAFRRRDIH